MATLWAQTATFDNINVGDDLPILVKFEFRPPAQEGVEPLHEDPVNTEKLSGYVRELLLKAFPAEAVEGDGTVIEPEILAPFLPGDTVSLSGRVRGKSEDGGRNTVECQVVVETEDGGETVARARTVISL